MYSTRGADTVSIMHMGVTMSRRSQAKSKESKEGLVGCLNFEYAKLYIDMYDRRNCRYGAQTDDMCGTYYWKCRNR